MIKLKIHKLVFTLFAYFNLVTISAQFHEVGAFIGASNYIGDIGTDKYIDPNSPAFGIVYKWNATDRFSLRAGFSTTKLKENEYGNSDINRFSRSLKLKTAYKKRWQELKLIFLNLISTMKP